MVEVIGVVIIIRVIGIIRAIILSDLPSRQEATRTPVLTDFCQHRFDC